MSEFTDGTAKGKTLSLVEMEKRLEALEKKKYRIMAGRKVHPTLSAWTDTEVVNRKNATFTMPFDGIVTYSIHTINTDADNYYCIKAPNGYAENGYEGKNYKSISLFCNKGDTVTVIKGPTAEYDLLLFPLYIEEA